jgi:hypothetical protein
MGSILKTMIIRCLIDQAECIENTQTLPQRVKACSVSGSALLSCGEEPCPLRLQTVFSTPNLIFIKIPPQFYLLRKYGCLHLEKNIGNDEPYFIRITKKIHREDSGAR